MKRFSLKKVLSVVMALALVAGTFGVSKNVSADEGNHIIFKYVSSVDDNSTAGVGTHDVKFIIVDENNNKIDESRIQWKESGEPSKHIKVDGDTVSAQSIPFPTVKGYEYVGCFFFWQGSNFTSDDMKRTVLSFKNMHTRSVAYSNYNSFIGWNTVDLPEAGKSDYANGERYMAYNPTGTLRVVYKENLPLKVEYYVDNNLTKTDDVTLDSNGEYVLTKLEDTDDVTYSDWKDATETVVKSLNILSFVKDASVGANVAKVYATSTKLPKVNYHYDPAVYDENQKEILYASEKLTADSVVKTEGPTKAAITATEENVTTTTEYTFKGWADAKGAVVTEFASLDADIDLYPVFTEKKTETTTAILDFYVAYSKDAVGTDMTVSGVKDPKDAEKFTPSIDHHTVTLSPASLAAIGFSEDVNTEDKSAVEKFVEAAFDIDAPEFSAEYETAIVNAFEAKNFNIYKDIPSNATNTSISIDWYVIKLENDGIHVDGMLVITYDQIFNVSFVVDENDVIVKEVIGGAKVEEIPAASKEGYDFTGWTTIVDGEEVVVTAEEILAAEVTADITYIAKYEEKKPEGGDQGGNQPQDKEEEDTEENNNGPVVPIIYDYTPVVTPEPTPEVEEPVVEIEETETPEGTPETEEPAAEETVVAPAEEEIPEEETVVAPAEEEPEVEVEVDETPEGTPELDIEEDITPEGLPQTGLVSAGVIYGIGAALVGLGSVVAVKARRKEDEE